jgi:hypothetical protein
MRTKYYSAKRKTKGKLVQLKDGRQGVVYYSEQKDVPAGKVAVDVWTKSPQVEMFHDPDFVIPDFKKMETVKMLCDAAGLKIIGFID